MEYLLSEITNPNSLHDKLTFGVDLSMLTTHSDGARERTEREMRQLGMAAGFAQVNLIMEADSLSIIEMHKD